MLTSQYWNKDKGSAYIVGTQGSDENHTCRSDNAKPNEIKRIREGGLRRWKCYTQGKAISAKWIISEWVKDYCVLRCCCYIGWSLLLPSLQLRSLHPSFWLRKVTHDRHIHAISKVKRKLYWKKLSVAWALARSESGTMFCTAMHASHHHKMNEVAVKLFVRLTDRRQTREEHAHSKSAAKFDDKDYPKVGVAFPQRIQRKC